MDASPPPLPAAGASPVAPPPSPAPAARPFPGFGFACLLVLVFLGVQMTAGILITIGASIVAAARGLPVASAANAAAHPGALTVANLAAFAAVFVWSAAMNRGAWRDLIPWRWPAPAAWPAVLTTSAGLVLVLSEVDNLVREVLPMPAFFVQMMQSVVASESAPWMSAFALVVLAPLTEEPLCRGVILRGLLARRRPWVAITATAFLFGVLHLNPWQFLPAFGLGLVYGWWYARTRSLALPIVAHALNNLGAFLANASPVHVPGLTPGPADAPPGVAHLPWEWIGIGVVLTAAGLGWTHRVLPRISASNAPARNTA